MKRVSLFLFLVSLSGLAHAGGFFSSGSGSGSQTFFSVYYEFLDYGSPDRVNGATTTFETSFTSHTAYGKAKFSHSVSSQSNCVEFDGEIVRNYDSNEDVRLENFSVWRGTGTDANDQRFVISVSSLTNGDVQTAIAFTGQTNVDLTDAAAGLSNSILALTSPVTLTGWKSKMSAGVPYTIQVCRDGDAAEDTSTISSYLRRMQIRVGQTAP